MRRPSVSKAELAKVMDALKSHGVQIATVDIQPSRVTITTTNAEDIVLPARLASENRAKERWPA